MQQRPLWLSVIGAVLFSAALVSGYGLLRHGSAPPAAEPDEEVPVIVEEPGIETPPVPDPLSGSIALFDEPAVAAWAGPLAVTIDNSPDARPQSGLDRADVVVEALAEGEITRLLAFFWTDPGATPIGPVRSARHYWVEISGAMQAPLAHAGGSTDALQMLRGGTYKDLDEIYNAQDYFYRSPDRVAPHNLYTDRDRMQAALMAPWLAPEPVPTSPRAPKAASEQADVDQVVIDWHPLNTATWVRRGDLFYRLNNGEPHRVQDGRDVAVPNLVFLETAGTYHGPDLGWRLDLTAGGRATVITAAGSWEGTWTLADGGFLLLPDGGAARPLLPGQVWVHLITGASSVTIVPAE